MQPVSHAMYHEHTAAIRQLQAEMEDLQRRQRQAEVSQISRQTDIVVVVAIVLSVVALAITIARVWW
jgi:hypothetical protein